MSGAENVHHAVWRLKAESFLAVDERRWADFAACFTDDARIDYSKARPGSVEQVPLIPSMTNYLDLVRQFIGSARTVHHATLPIIDIIDDDKARALWRMEDIIVRPPDDPRPSGHGYGLYEDEYRRTQNGWRIASLAFTRTLFLPLSDPLPGG